MSWIASYLTDRRQRVKSKSFAGDWLRVEAGVIQGSVIGPILFIIFISDLHTFLPLNANISKYADDILATVFGQDIQNHLPQTIVNDVQAWCIGNKMRLNSNKCKFLSIQSPLAIKPPIITLCSTPLEYVQSHKYLGIVINSTLSWEQQWDRVRLITASLPYLIKNLKHLGFQTDILVSVYRSYWLSHFIYSAPVLISTAASTQIDMQRYQNRILRIIGI